MASSTPSSTPASGASSRSAAASGARAQASAHSVPAAPRGRGRPREFDMDYALDQAVGVFCERGYHATSIADLTGAMHLAAGSVYKAFADKRAVFLAALERYTQVSAEKLRLRLAAGRSGRERVHIALNYYAECACGAQGRRGCLVIGGAAELGTFDAEVARRVTAALQRIDKLMAELIRQGQADGSIAPTLDAATIARLMLCLLQGMRVVGKTGRSRAEMAAVADAAMQLLG